MDGNPSLLMTPLPQVIPPQVFCPRCKFRTPGPYGADNEMRCGADPAKPRVMDVRECPEKKFAADDFLSTPEPVRDGSIIPGPGDVVKFVLTKLGINAGENCGCDAMGQQMNRWGYTGCLLHLDEIVQWFRAKAKERGIELTPLAVFNAIRDAWGAQKKAKTP